MGAIGNARQAAGLAQRGGYYDTLITFLDHAAHEQFMKSAQRELLMVDSDPAKLLARFASHKALVAQKWLGAEQT